MSVLDENCDIPLLDFCGIEIWKFHEFEKRYEYTNSYILKLFDNFNIQTSLHSENVTKNHKNEFEVLTEKNKQLKHEIDSKVDELSQQRIQYEHFKKDQKMLTQEIKDTHEAFLMAKKYYKKFMKMYYTIESTDGDKQIIYIQFFTENKTDSKNYSVRLIRDSKTTTYELLDTIPPLSIHTELQRILKETNDVPGLLCCIRDAFLANKTKKKETEVKKKLNDNTKVKKI